MRAYHKTCPKTMRDCGSEGENKRNGMEDWREETNRVLCIKETGEEDLESRDSSERRFVHRCHAGSIRASLAFINCRLSPVAVAGWEGGSEWHITPTQPEGSSVCDTLRVNIRRVKSVVPWAKMTSIIIVHSNLNTPPQKQDTSR